jgi:hypothetical protein
MVETSEPGIEVIVAAGDGLSSTGPQLGASFPENRECARCSNRSRTPISAVGAIR